VAVTTTFYVNIVPVLPIVELVRRSSPASHIVVGGPLIEGLCADGLGDLVQDLLHGMDADSYVLESQGESTLEHLCRALTSGGSLESVPNLIRRTDAGWAMTRRMPENNALDDCVIDWSGFGAAEIGVTAQTRTARSCAFKCSFCDYPIRAGDLATASVATVRGELRALARLGVRNLVFVDDTFNVPPTRFKSLCRMMIEEDLGLEWYSYFRCSNARDEETFDLAAASGCRGVFLGIESGDPRILANMNKLAKDDQYRTGIARLKERGITTFASIIVGFPGETEESVQNTIDFLEETKPTFWRAQPWWGNERSPVYRRRSEYDIRGNGYKWSHSTMDSSEAASWCDRMFETVRGSTWLPLYDFDFWSLPYLAGKGLSADDVVSLLTVSQELMCARDRDHADVPRVAALAGELERRAAEVDVAPARFEFPRMMP
jgi:p-methyltransferase